MVKSQEWCSVLLSDWIKEKMVDIQTGPFGTILKASEFIKHGIPIISVSEIRDGYIRINEETPCISEETISRLPAYGLKENDLVFARKGSVDRCALIRADNNSLFLGSDAIRLRLLSPELHPLFVFYLFHSSTVKQHLIQNSYGTTMAGLNETILASVPIRYPIDINEQQQIATALSDVDGYIVALERLIAKKRDIKKGAMQELLTGKRRLPGFDGEWVTMNLAAQSTLKARIGWQGLTTSEYLDEGYSYLVTGTDFDNGKISWVTCHFVDKRRYDQDANIQVVNDDILITKDGTIGKVAIVQGLNKKATLNSGVFVLRPKAGAYDVRYVYYVLLSQVFARFLEKLAAGSTINHLYQKDFVTFEFYVPHTIEEQVAISSILSDIDAEIDALVAELLKVNSIKQGMMQALLTGRVRPTSVEAEDEPSTKTAKCVSPLEVIEPSKIKKEIVAAHSGSHNQQIDDAVIIAGIVNALYSEKYLLGRKKVQKCLYLLRRHQNESTAAFKKKAAGPYAHEVRYNGGELIAEKNNYIVTTITDKGTTFARGSNIDQALKYILDWGYQPDIDWLIDKLKYKKVDELELMATVDMAICDLNEAGIPVSLAAIKHLIATNSEWVAELSKQSFSDDNIDRAIGELKSLL